MLSLWPASGRGALEDLNKQSYHQFYNPMNQIISKSITHYSRSTATLLWLCQLLSSCGGAAGERGTDLTGPLPPASAAAATTEPEIMHETLAGHADHMEEVSYVDIAGNGGTIPVDVAHTSISALLASIKGQAGFMHVVCRLAHQGGVVCREDDHRLLHEVVDQETIRAGQLTIVKVQNSTIAQELLGDNYLGPDAWQKLGVPEEEAKAITLPILSDDMLAEIRRLLELGQQPLLVLDLGKSIQEIERLCQARGINVLSHNAEILRAERCYQEPDVDHPRWLLLPSSDNGVLPGSRNKRYADQVKYMEENYPGYEVGGVRELVTIAMLKYLQDGMVLFTRDPITYGQCKEQYQEGDWREEKKVLGANDKNEFGSVSGFVVSLYHGHAEVLGVFAVWASS